MQEPPDLKSDWLSKIRLFSSKKLNRSLKISLSKISAHIGSKKLDHSFQDLFITFFVDRNNILLFSSLTETNHYLLKASSKISFGGP